MANVDAIVQRVLTTIEARPTRQDEEWLIVVTADHGGNSFDLQHGDLNEECRVIFLIFSGDGIKKGEIPPDCETQVSHMDVFPSVMEYLNIPIKEEWDLDGKSRLEWVTPKSEIEKCDLS